MQRQLDVNVGDFLSVRDELFELDKIKCEGAILRSKAQYAVEGEKNTAFFLNLEKTRQSRVYIDKIKNKDGETVDSFVEILENVQNYYEALFCSEVHNVDLSEKIVNNLDIKLSNEDKIMCDQILTIKDINNAIDQLLQNKSPGSDGLTAYFYVCFRSVLVPILLKLYNDIEIKQVVPDTMAEGLITLLFKKGDRTEMANYRPITLLNTDYKILMKIFANRFKSVIHTIVSPTQAYSVPGREVTDIISTIRDVVEFLKFTNKEGIVLSIDFNKAFDRVEHYFLFRVLEKFNFGERIINWLRLMYSTATARVKCNGVLTDSFPLQRSVRQGCPMSSILYSLVVEPLSKMIKSDNLIRGIALPGGNTCVIQQFADDTTITVQDMSSITRTIELIHLYGKASGSVINMTKSEIMFVNSLESSLTEHNFTVQSQHLKILGTYVGKDGRKARDLTWEEHLRKLESTLNFWRLRNLKLGGKVIIINSLIVSRLYYTLAVLDLPLWVVKRLE